MSCVMAYITVGNVDEANEISQVLVSEQLAACTNVISGMTSHYMWEGEAKQDEEVVLLAKTTAEGFEALKERVIALHSYDLPCIVVLPIETGHMAYLDWVIKQVS